MILMSSGAPYTAGSSGHTGAHSQRTQNPRHRPFRTALDDQQSIDIGQWRKMQPGGRLFHPPQRTVLILQNQFASVTFGIHRKIVFNGYLLAVFKRNNQIVSMAIQFGYVLRVDF